MAKFCPQCGTPCDDNAAFCAGCGNKFAPAAPQQPVYQAPQQPVYQAPQQPQYQAPQQPVYQAPQQPQYQAPAAPAAPAMSTEEKIRKNMKIVVAVFAVVMLLAGIMNLFGMYEVEANGGAAIQLSDFREQLGEMMDSMGSMGGDFDLGAIIDNDLLMPLIQILCFLGSSYVLGIFATIGGLLAAYALYQFVNNQAGSAKSFNKAISVGGIGSIIALVMALLGSNIEISIMGYSQTLEIAVNFTFWLAGIVGVAYIYLRKSMLKGNLSPLK